VTTAPQTAVRYQGGSSSGSEAGFTLLEVIVALILTTLVVMLAYGAARVSFDAKTRVGAERRALQGQRAARQMLADALRNVQSPLHPSDPAFELHGDRLSFVAASGAPPLDPDYDWLITVGSAGGRVTLAAKPLGHAPAQEVNLTLPQVTRWDVRVLVPGNTVGWLREWPAGSQLPKAVEMRFWNDSLPLGDPLLVTLVP
jgi:prepilin-type N-terminal cleavage/methylation domain-containing protein